jgi:hypothetical protein
MIYLSGHVRRELFGRFNLGFMLTPQMGNRLPDGEMWAADTGGFTGREFVLDKYMRWLGKHDRAHCLFATAPDVLCDAERTLIVAPPVLRKLRAEGYSPALVAQNGLTVGDTPWELFDCLFIGGDTRWKLGSEAIALMEEAKQRGKWVHMGRVNSYSRLLKAKHLGCDSADGTYIKFGPDINGPKVQRWIKAIESQASFF